MTKKELSQYYYLEQEIKSAKEEIEALRAKLIRVTQLLNDMPRGHVLEEKVEEILDDLTERKILLYEKIEKAEQERNRILKYISGIDDVLMRLIIQYRYINLLPWAKVAYFVGGNNTPDGVRIMSERYISSQRQGES